MDRTSLQKAAERIERRAQKRKRGNPDPFFEGIAVALADLVRLHDQPGMAADVLAGHAFSLSDFAGCEPYDLNVIRKLYRTEAALKQ